MNFFEIYWNMFQDAIISVLSRSSVWLGWVILFIMLLSLTYWRLYRWAKKRNSDMDNIQRNLKRR